VVFFVSHLSSGWIWFMVFNATFNNISVISWWSVLLVEETGVPGENHSSGWDILEVLSDLNSVYYFFP